MKEKVLIVLSGGQDSTTCLFLAKQRGFELHAITFDYGQRHTAELDAARSVARMAGVDILDHEYIAVPDILKSVSPLTSGAKLEQYENAQQMDEVIGNRIEKTFVPMRNTLFLTIAANRAAYLGATKIYTGICAADNANYPDCTAQFRSSMELLINDSLGRTPFDEDTDWMEIVCPLLNMTKADSVRLAHKMPDLWKALAYTHTSYDGQYPPTDMNHANVLRAQGFEEANLPDPLVLRAWSEGKMDLPVQENYRATLVFDECRLLGFPVRAL